MDAPPYTVNKILEVLKSAPYYAQRGVVVGSSALVLHGIIEAAPDLDLAIPKHVMDYHADEPSPPARYLTSHRCGIDFVALDDVVWETVYGVRVATLPTLLALYETLHRNKDKKHIELISKTLMSTY